jgi:hypothetical protein
VNLDVSTLKPLLEHAIRAGTVEQWCKLAIEFAETAAQKVSDMTAEAAQLKHVAEHNAKVAAQFRDRISELESGTAEVIEATEVTQTAAERVLQMRDDFLMLVAALNLAGDFITAMEAQAIVIQVHKFEEGHNMENAAWPPQADSEGGLKWIGD